jgi:hypothetical protein
LTETIGSPTPTSIPFVVSKQLPDSNLYYPIEPQRTWHFRQSIDYSVTANYAVFDVLSRNKDTFLYNIYQMGKNSIARGSTDTWTATPRRVLAAQAALTRPADTVQGAATQQPQAGAARATTLEQFRMLLREPATRDPRGFIITADQPDFPTATKFVNALLKTGITVHRASAPFSVAGKSYPAGSFVVKSAQPFRPHVLDMFEPQDHPDDIPYPGGAPTRPYDNAGWTLAYQMGVRFDRVLDAFDGPFDKVDGLQKPQAGTVTDAATPAGFVMSHAPNDAFTAINRLLAAGEDVSWVTTGTRPGIFFIASKPSTRGAVSRLAADLGVSFEAVPARPSGEAITLRRPRIGLADQYGGSMPSGWTRFILEQFEFPFEVVFPKSLDSGDLSSRFDVLIFPSGVGPSSGASGAAPEQEPMNVPAEYQPMLGAYTAARTGPALKKFVEAGGTVLAIGRSAGSIAQVLGIPIQNHVIERLPDGSVRPVAAEKYYVPGSVLRVAVDNTAPVAHGFDTEADVFFDNSPVFSLGPEAVVRGLRPIAWFDTAAPLRSGWAFGQGYLEGGVQVIDAPIGKGKLFMFAPEITFRAQPHGSFKFLFNGIYLAAASDVSGSEPRRKPER